MSAISLQRQAERATMAWQAAVNRLDEVQRKKSTSVEELAQKRIYVAECEAVMKTMNAVARFPDAVRATLEACIAAEKKGQGQ